MDRAEALRASLEAVCALAVREVALPDGGVRMHVVRDPDALLDALIALPADHPDRLDEKMGYWGELWPSSIVLANWVVAHGEGLVGKLVLELGCGPGLAGLAAGRRGAEVVATDYEANALRLTCLNWLENLGREPVTVRLDWREPDAGLASDWILAADVAYEARFFEPLCRSFAALLRPGGQVLLAEPGRPVAAGFFRLLAERGWQVERVGGEGGVSVYALGGGQ